MRFVKPRMDPPASLSNGPDDLPEDDPVWTYGLGFNLLLAGGAIWITTRWLRTPVRTLKKGIRIA
jgi:ABC-2 type transport system permease protein